MQIMRNFASYYTRHLLYCIVSDPYPVLQRNPAFGRGTCSRPLAQLKSMALRKVPSLLCFPLEVVRESVAAAGGQQRRRRRGNAMRGIESIPSAARERAPLDRTGEHKSMWAGWPRSTSRPTRKHLTYGRVGPLEESSALLG
jgi:hypothetical protein